MNVAALLRSLLNARGFRELQKDSRGAVALVFGLTLVPLMLLVGLATDRMNIARTQGQLNKLVDTAALAGAKAAANEASAHGCTKVDGDDNDKGKGNDKTCSNATKAALAAINQFIAADGSSKQNGLKLQTSVTQGSDGAWTVKIDYTATSPLYFGAIAGFKQANLGNSISASLNLGANTYLNFYLLLDISMSQGIGSTTDDINRMQAMTGCQFGCHTAGYQSTYYDGPHNAGIRFRIDDLRDATSALVTQAKTTASGASGDKIKMGLFSFDEAVHTHVDTTSDLSSVASAVSGLDLPTYDNGTQIKDALSWINSHKIIGGGSGTTDKSPLEIVFLVTDGVEDGIYTGWNGIAGTPGVGLPWWGTQAGKPAATGATPIGACDALKQKGVTVAVVYTTYVPFTGTVQYDNLIGPFATDIPANLRSCASSGYFFTASSPAEITSGMQQLFTKAIQSSALRLRK